MVHTGVHPNQCTRSSRCIAIPSTQFPTPVALLPASSGIPSRHRDWLLLQHCHIHSPTSLQSHRQKIPTEKPPIRQGSVSCSPSLCCHHPLSIHLPTIPFFYSAVNRCSSMCDHSLLFAIHGPPDSRLQSWCSGSLLYEAPGSTMGFWRRRQGTRITSFFGVSETLHSEAAQPGSHCHTPQRSVSSPGEWMLLLRPRPRSLPR